MVKTHNYPAKKTLQMEFPEGQKIRTETFVYRDLDHAEWIWKTNLSKYIVAMLTRWVKQRAYALDYMHDLTPEKEYAIGALRMMLENYSESKLDVIAYQVNKHIDDIDKIQPGRGSRYYNNYVRIILPIRNWCRERVNRSYQSV